MGLSQRDPLASFFLGDGEKEAVQNKISQMASQQNIKDYIAEPVGAAINQLNNRGIAESSVGDNAISQAATQGDAAYWQKQMAANGTLKDTNTILGQVLNAGAATTELSQLGKVFKLFE